jgi:hypothetical protein
MALRTAPSPSHANMGLKQYRDHISVPEQLHRHVPKNCLCDWQRIEFWPTV